MFHLTEEWVADIPKIEQNKLLFHELI